MIIKIMKKISLALCLSALVASAPMNTFASERAPDYVHHNMYKQENSVVMYEKSIVCAPGTGPTTPSSSGGGGESSGSSGAVAADSTGAQVYNYLLEKGLSPVQALGIIGNLMQESGENQTLNLNPSASNGPSIGIAQWEGTRRYGTTTSSLQGFAASQGKPMTDLGVQMDFMWHELNTTYKKNTLDPILASTTLEQSTSIFLNQYERPRVRDFQNRLNLANAAAQQLGVDTGSAAATQPTAPAASSLSTSPSTTVDCTPKNENGEGGGSGEAGGSGSGNGEACWVIDKKWYDDPKTHYSVVKGHQANSGFYYKYGDGQRYAIDISPPGAKGTPQYAIFGGVVTRTNLPSSRGTNGGIEITTTLPGGKTIKTLYAHSSGITQKVGDTVPTCGQIGVLDSLGNSSVPHIHLEINYDGKPICGNDIMNDLAQNKPINLDNLASRATPNCLGR